MTRTKLYVEDSGEAHLPAVLFLHAFPLDSTMFVAQSTSLAGRARRVLVDYPGIGRSPLSARPLFFEHLVDDVLSTLDERGLDRVALVGISMGGYLALRIAERAPSRMTGLLLGGTHPFADSDAQKLKRAAGARAIAESGLTNYANAFLEGALSKATRTNQPELAPSLRSAITKNHELGVEALLLALASRSDTSASLKSHPFPVHLVAGEEDALIPLSLMESTKEKLSLAKLTVLPQAGHLMNLEQPALFNAALSDFLDELGIPKRS